MTSFRPGKRVSRADRFYLACFKNDKFENKSRNSLFRIEPPKVVIQLDPSILPRQQVKIINITKKSQRCFVLPSENEAFKFSFKNQESIAPGLSMPVEVFLDKLPLMSQEYPKAWLKIHCFDDQNLKILIEVTEPESTFDYNIPQTIDFGLVPLCESVSQKIMISPNTKDGEISNVTILEPHEDVTVQIIKGEDTNEPSYVEVTYYPTSYSTMTMALMILSPAIKNYFPVVRVTGYCRPMAFRDQLQKFSDRKALFFQQCQKELSKRNKLCQENEAERRIGSQPVKKQPLVETWPDFAPYRLWWLQKDFVRYPAPDVLLGPLGRTDEENAQMKKQAEDTFHQEVNDIKYRMKQIQLHCDITNLGMTGFEESMYDYDMDWNMYMTLRKFLADESAFQSHELTAIKQRIIKTPEMSPEGKIKRNPQCYSWFTRFHPLCKFIQAGRQVIILNRLAKRLHMLQQYIIDLQSPVVEEEAQSEDPKPEKIKFFGSEFTFVPN